MKFWEAMKALGEGKKVKPTDNMSWCETPHLITLCMQREWDIYEEPKNRREVAEQSYMEICTAIDQLKNLGVQVEYPKEIWVNEERFQFPINKHDHTLSFAEVVKGIKQRKRFKRKEWKSWIGKEHLWCACLTIEDFEATDWMEVK